MTAEPTLVFVDSHIFSVGEIAWGLGPEQPVTAPLCLVFEPRESETYVRTGIASGRVRVYGQPLSSRPSAVADGWEDVAEVSLTITEGPLIAAGMEESIGPQVRLDAHGPADYRLRVHARGRDTDYDGSSLEPVEDYLILAWPEKHSPPHVLQSTTRVSEIELHF